MTAFASYAAAALHSDMLRQQKIAALQATYNGSIGNASAYTTFVTGVAAAELAHYERLAAAGPAFGIMNGASIRPGVNAQSSHGASWLSSGSDTN